MDVSAKKGPFIIQQSPHQGGQFIIPGESSTVIARNKAESARKRTVSVKDQIKMIQEQVERQGLKEETRRKKVFLVSISKNQFERIENYKIIGRENTDFKVEESQGDEPEPPLPVLKT